MQKTDIIIIGAGILGLSTAMQLLQKRPGINLLILEKEKEIAEHQTGHNSGVIHSGIYYKPGSLKAKNCIDGVQRLISFCSEKGIAFQQCGKLIVATTKEELPRLEELQRRGLANGVPRLERVGPERIKEIEPHAAGIAALYSPETAIVDFVQVAQAYANEIKRLGGQIVTQAPVKAITRKLDGFTVQAGIKEYQAAQLINCAGLQADRLANQVEKEVCPKQIVPFRGEYYELVASKRGLVKGLIYPVPDPKFPFLGVHLSRTMDGRVEAGPNAVLALSREGYTKKDLRFRDCMDILTYKGFWYMAARYWKIGLYEVYRSFSKASFTKALQRLIPELQADDLVRAEAGVRSQVVLPNGKMFDDFAIIQKEGIIHVLNAPSPAATASLAIGDYLSNLILQKNS